MPLIRSAIAPSSNPKSLIGTSLSKGFQPPNPHKTHHYTVSDEIHDHIFAPKNGGIRAYMTQQGKGIKRGDYLILQAGSNSNRYQVDKISYYSDPPDMWIALLRQC